MELTVAQKLESLLKLQQIDNKLDEIYKVRGDLPYEVRDLEDEVVQLETRLKKYNDEVANLDAATSDKRNSIKNAELLIKKYEAQLEEVKNNREYDAITKEIESQKLDIDLFNKKIKEERIKAENAKKQAEDTVLLIEDKKKELQIKQKELDSIMEETRVEEEKLLKDREKRGKQVEERLFLSYTKIRANSTNGLAVVLVQRGACGGCFNMVPPQRQADIKEKKKLIVCEHCGRILADVEDIPVAEEKPKKATKKVIATARPMPEIDLD
jgi:predicted  nucleic acid-binding Zn-ribbon protein